MSKQLARTWPASEIASLRRDVEALKRRAPVASTGGNPSCGGSRYHLGTFGNFPTTLSPITWENFNTTDSSIYTWNSSDTVTVHQGGLYASMLYVVPDVGWPTSPTGPVYFMGHTNHQNAPFGLDPFAAHPAVDLYAPSGAEIVPAFTLHHESSSFTFQGGIQNETGASWALSTAFFFLWRISDFLSGL